jgi:hypothetical protein
MCLFYNAGKLVSILSYACMEQLPKTTEQHSRLLIQAAIHYARNGWPVFPLHNKKPYEFITPGVKSHGYKDATTDEETIRAFWTYHPGATIGLATGERSGVIILDIDPPEGYYNLKEL